MPRHRVPICRQLFVEFATVSDVEKAGEGDEPYLQGMLEEFKAHRKVSLRERRPYWPGLENRPAKAARARTFQGHMFAGQMRVVNERSSFNFLRKLPENSGAGRQGDESWNARAL